MLIIIDEVKFKDYDKIVKLGLDIMYVFKFKLKYKIL